MKKFINMLLLVATTYFLCGCTTPGTEIDRERDFRDIFTFTVAKGSAFKLRLGPVQAGFVYPPKQLETGMRGGDYYKPYKWDYDSSLLIYGEERFHGTDLNMQRGKSYEANYMACVGIAKSWHPMIIDEEEGYDKPEVKYPWYYYTQTELVIGIWNRYRVGINWGEMLDFCLGWCNLDMYGDDLKIKELMDLAKEAEKQRSTNEVIIDLSKDIKPDNSEK
jgi:hypothetical protein